MRKIWAETEMLLDCKLNEFKSLSLLETYEHELTGRYDLYTKLVFDYTDFMRCEDEESSEKYEAFVQENWDKKKRLRS